MYYFAYGSNMLTRRMRARVPSARVVAVARLPEYRIDFRKQGADGSMKCDLVPDEIETAWGVVYQIDPGERGALDAAEGEGYRPVEEIAMRADGAAPLTVFTYRARDEWIGWGKPFDWYRDLVVAGAREHDLPAPYAEALAEMEADLDPDPERAAENRP